MAAPERSFTGDGSTRSWAISFPFIHGSHVKASVDGVEVDVVVTPGLVTLDAGEDTPGVGAVGRIYRETPTDQLATYLGSTLNDSESNRIGNLQALYLAEERSGGLRVLDMALTPLGNIAQRALKILGFDADGDATLLSDVPTAGVAASSFWQTVLPAASAAASRTLLNVLKGDWLTTQGDLLTRDGSDYKRLPRGTAGQYLGVSGSDLEWQTPVVYANNSGGVRQTVQYGPVTSAGLPSFLPSTNAALSITTQNVSSTYPLIASAANGSGALGPVNSIGYSAANLTWSGLTASRAAATPNYLYGTIAGGVITPASTILAPVYQWGGTPATTNGQITFNISEMKAYLGNGTTAPQTNLVVFGEAATDGTGVISTVAYAYNGRYDSGYTATLPGAWTATPKDHNIGVVPRVMDFRACNTTTEAGYAVGDEVGMGSFFMNDGINPYATPSLKAGTKTMSVKTGSTGFLAVSFSASNVQTLTAGNWKWRMIADRGW